MDLIGPLPKTSRGNKYIVTLTDYFSKWAEAAPPFNKTAEGIAKFMYSVSLKYTKLLHTLIFALIESRVAIVIDRQQNDIIIDY